jgi:TonB family protein
MTAATLSMDFTQARSRTRRTMTVSIALHVLLFLWIALHPITQQEIPRITEITLLSPGDLAPAGSPAPPAPAPAAASPSAGLAATAPREVRFQRLARAADFAPDPQSPEALADQLTTRLAAMQQTAVTPTTGAATTIVPASLFGAGASPAGVPGGTGPAMALHRGGGGGGGPSLNLTRGGGGMGAAPALIGAPAGVGGGAAGAPARETESTARRNIAGATLLGPIADRAVLAHPLPGYPEWAKREAVEGSVSLYFVVRPDGGVKENIVVQKTAGFEDFDESARTALRGWRFEPLRSGRTGEQWGVITFNFRLTSAG